MQKLLCIIVLFAFSLCAEAKHLYLEKEYQKQWCSMQTDCTLEYKLADRTRIDCLTSTHSIEFDFAQKWAEAIGQSLYYSSMTNRKAGVVLILENKSNEQKYLERLLIIAEKHGIDVWIISPESMPAK